MLPRHNRRARRGFTLIELVVVMVIVVILAAGVAPSLGGLVHGSQLRSLLRQAASQLTYAREQAVSTGLIYRVACDSSNGLLSLEKEPEPVDQPGVFQTVQVSTFRLVRLPDEARIERLELNGDIPSVDQSYIYFFPDGHSDAARLTIVFRNNEYFIETAALTGRVQVKDSSGEIYR